MFLKIHPLVVCQRSQHMHINGILCLFSVHDGCVCDIKCVLWKPLWLHLTYKCDFKCCLQHLRCFPLHGCTYHKIAHCFIFHGKSIWKERNIHGNIAGTNRKLSLRKAVFAYLAKFSWSSIALISQNRPIYSNMFVKENHYFGKLYFI